MAGTRGHGQSHKATLPQSTCALSPRTCTVSCLRDAELSWQCGDLTCEGGTCICVGQTRATAATY